MNAITLIGRIFRGPEIFLDPDITRLYLKFHLSFYNQGSPEECLGKENLIQSVYSISVHDLPTFLMWGQEGTVLVFSGSLDTEISHRQATFHIYDINPYKEEKK